MVVANKETSLRCFSNRQQEALLAVVSVDGVNVISQTGFVPDPRG